MDPEAYVIRSHEIFEHPLKVDLEQQVEIETPDAWKNDLDQDRIRILPLVNDRQQRYRSGWCTYTYEHTQAPELEIICGGVNAKTPKASAIWRQGNLMHFGFEQSPAEMNQNGRSLLVNSICYISRFADDRILVSTPSPFYSSQRFRQRDVFDRLVKSDRDLEGYLDAYLEGRARSEVRGVTRAELAQWYAEQGAYLRLNERGKFVLDEDAEAFGVATNSPAFLPAAIDALADDARAELARTLLARYVSSDASVGAPEGWQAGDWRTWYEGNRDYLFFTDSGGCHWRIDLLARQRGVPTSQLRGAARASREPVSR